MSHTEPLTASERRWLFGELHRPRRNKSGATIVGCFACGRPKDHCHVNCPVLRITAKLELSDVAQYKKRERQARTADDPEPKGTGILVRK